MAKAAAARKYRQEAKDAVLAQGIESGPWETATLQAMFFFSVNRRRDGVNHNQMLKPAQDGVVDAGLIVDDDHEHLTTLPPKFGYSKRNPRVEITITRTIGDARQ
jgi:hypothetical protein